MTRARDIANLVDSNGDVVAGALDNVPPADLVNDTSPQLGGNLDGQSNEITDVSKLGVGTASPQVELHLKDTGGLSRIRLEGTAASADNFEIGQGTTGVSNSGFEIRDIDAGATRMMLDSSGNMGLGSTAPQANIHVNSSSGDADLILGTASQAVRLDQNSIRTTTNSDLALFTNGNNPQVTLSQSNGNVGINNATPDSQLDVIGPIMMKPSSASGNWRRELGVWSSIEQVGSNGSSWTSGYLHVKTNMGGMFRADFVGYDYGSGTGVDSVGVGYVHNNSIIATQIYHRNPSAGNGVKLNRIYLNNDNTTVTFVLYTTSWYVTHLMMDAYCQSGGKAVVATSMRSNNSDYY